MNSLNASAVEWKPSTEANTHQTNLKIAPEWKPSLTVYDYKKDIQILRQNMAELGIKNTEKDNIIRELEKERQDLIDNFVKKIKTLENDNTKLIQQKQQHREISLEYKEKFKLLDFQNEKLSKENKRLFRENQELTKTKMNMNKQFKLQYYQEIDLLKVYIDKLNDSEYNENAKKLTKKLTQEKIYNLVLESEIDKKNTQIIKHYRIINELKTEKNELSQLYEETKQSLQKQTLKYESNIENDSLTKLYEETKKKLEETIQKKAELISKLVTESSEFICPISFELMNDPVITVDGHSYEREYIEDWLKNNNTSPNTNEILETNKLIPNYALRGLIVSYNERKYEFDSTKSS